MTLQEYCAGLLRKRVAVLGLGISNLPLARTLLSHGVRITARDRRTEAQLGDTASELRALGAEMICGAGYLDGLTEDVIFRTPGLMPHTPELEAAIARGASLTSEMEAFFETCPCHMIAVTGSDGKTTTTTLIAELLRAAGSMVQLGGNLGVPLFARTDEMGQADYAVLELSSFQLMTMRKSPEIAVVTNVAPNHLDMHRDMEEYVRAKENIFLYQDEAGRTILNFDNEITRAYAAKTPGTAVFFSRQNALETGICLDGSWIVRKTRAGTARILDTHEIKIPGVHNIENYMAAIAAVGDKVPAETIRGVARAFGGVEHRIELVREHRGVKYYNDSIASSPTRTTAGLRAFPEKVILIAGGKDKGVPFDTLGPEIIAHVKKLVVTGLTAEKIRAAVVNCPDYQGEPEIFIEPEFEKAVFTAADAARPGDIVILSPACTSYDRFHNFEERGNYFKELVNGLD